MRIRLISCRIVKLLPFLATVACAPVMQGIIATSNGPRPGTTSVGGGHNPQGIPLRLSPAATPVVLPSDVLASRGVHLDSAIPSAPKLPAKAESAAFGAANAAIVTACVLSDIFPLFWERRINDRSDCDMEENKRLHPVVVTVPKAPILVR